MSATEEKTLSSILGEKGMKNFGEAIISNIETLGLGVLSKSDFEAYMFHCILENIPEESLKQLQSDKKELSYELRRLLKVTPTKLKSLGMIRSSKYLTLDLNDEKNWTKICNAISGKTFEIEDKANGKIRIYIDDVHVIQLIEKYIIENGSSIDYKRNANQVVLNYSGFFHLVEGILNNSGKDLVEFRNEVFKKGIWKINEEEKDKGKGKTKTTVSIDTAKALEKIKDSKARKDQFRSILDDLSKVVGIVSPLLTLIP